MRNHWLMTSWFGLGFVILGALLLAWFASATPCAAPASAPLAGFASGRAFSDIRQMAQLPHPTGSVENIRVRDHLMVRLAGLGLSPKLQRGNGAPWRSGRSKGYTVENVVASVPGSDLRAPALLVMSHYDSVPKSPGAADDMAGVATALELIRLLKLGPSPVRRVIFLFTDGEEPGLLGAQVFFDDPAASHAIGFVVNMEARGGGGRALMFQTSPASGGAERLFAAHAAGPQSNSLAAFIYSKMPNDTDFSVALAHGLPGLNYAFIGRPQLYHTAAAVPAAVDSGSVQSLGDQAWAIVKTLAYTPALPPRSPDVTWFDIFGCLVVSYWPILGWLPIALAGSLLAAAFRLQRRSSGLTAGAVALGAAQSLGATFLSGAVLYLYGLLTIKGYYQALSHPWRTEGAVALAVFASSIFVFRVVRPRKPLARWWGAVFFAWLVAIGLQLAAPTTAFLAAWPSLFAALALALTSRPTAGIVSAVLAFVCSLIALGLLFEVWHVVVLGVGLIMPFIGASLLPLGLAPLAPFLLGKAAPVPDLPVVDALLND